MVASSDHPGGADILDAFIVKGPGGERFRILNMRTHAPPGQPWGDDFMVAQEYLQDGQAWRTLPLDVVWYHRLRRTMSEWPPEEARGASWRDDTLCVSYESRWYPDSPDKHHHALWHAYFDSGHRRWRLKRMHILDEKEGARR
jgi:hypothetical protein